MRRTAIVARQRTPAGAAKLGLAFGEPMRHRDALVEDEAFALPQALLGGHGFQIFQDAALEMIDLCNPERADIGRRLLAAYAAGAVHGDLAPFERLTVVRNPVRKFAECRRARIDGVAERAERHLVIVARVDDDRIGIGDQRIPVDRLDIGAGIRQRVDLVDAHRHDLLLQPHLHAMERHHGRRAEFDLQSGHSGNRFETNDQLVDRVRRSGDRAVDPFGGNEQRALDAAAAAEGGERLAQRVRCSRSGRSGRARRRGYPAWRWMGPWACAYCDRRAVARCACIRGRAGPVLLSGSQ